MRWPVALVPAVAIAATAAVTASSCGGLGASAAKVPGRPPGVVFAVVWPILYVTTGLAWALSAADADKAFVALVLLLCAWLPVYSCFSRPAAAGVLGASAVGAIALSAWRFSKGERWAGGLVVPLCAWLAFATYLNVAEVATTKIIH